MNKSFVNKFLLKNIFIEHTSNMYNSCKGFYETIYCHIFFKLNRLSSTVYTYLSLFCLKDFCDLEVSAVSMHSSIAFIMCLCRLI